MAKSKRKAKKDNSEQTDPDSGPSFEESVSELDSIVHDLEDGSLGLEESLTRFERAIGLLKGCYQVLERAEQRIDLLTGFDAEGNPVVTPFDASATMGAEQSPAAGRRKKRAKSGPTTEQADETQDDESSTLF